MLYCSVLSSLLLSEFSCQGDSPNPVVYSPEMDRISQPRNGMWCLKSNRNRLKMNLEFLALCVRQQLLGHFPRVAWDEDWNFRNWIELSESIRLSPDIYSKLI
jgi:hypothetical protein